MSKKKTIRIIIGKDELTKPRVRIPRPGGPMKSKKGKGSYKRKPKHPKKEVTR